MKKQYSPPLKCVFLLFIFFFLIVVSCSDDCDCEEDETPMEGVLSPCENGFAGIYPCNGYDLMAHLTLNELTNSNAAGNDCWGWTDPDSDKEYALIGTSTGTVFVDISNPEKPIILGTLPTISPNDPDGGYNWRDIKVYNNNAFIVSEAVGHGMQVFDLTRLRDTTKLPKIYNEDAHYNGFGDAHNIFINESSGFAYVVGSITFGGGAHFINIQNPLSPVAAGGLSEGGYSHDVQVVTYNGPDSDYNGREILIGSNENEVVIADITNKSNPQIISTVTYSNVIYTHQGSFTKDLKYFIVGDELDEINFGGNSRTLIFDLTDLDNPSLHTTYFGQTEAIDHNGYVKNDTFYLANYTAGVRFLDISDINNIHEIGYFDTYPNNDNVTFNGAWSVYPYFESGNIIISDVDGGLFVIRKSDTSK